METTSSPSTNSRPRVVMSERHDRFSLFRPMVAKVYAEVGGYTHSTYNNSWLQTVGLVLWCGVLRFCASSKVCFEGAARDVKGTTTKGEVQIFSGGGRGLDLVKGLRIRSEKR